MAEPTSAPDPSSAVNVVAVPSVIATHGSFPLARAATAAATRSGADLPRLLGADVESGLDAARYLDDIADAEQAQRTLEHADHARNDRADNTAVDAAHVHAVQQKHLLQLAGVVVARQLRLGCDGGRENLSVLLIAAEQKRGCFLH